MPDTTAAAGPLAPDGSVVVVGGSLAGLRTAEGLRSGGFTGRLVLVGEEPHLPYDRPPLSKQVLAGTWTPDQATLADQGRLDALGVECHLGCPATALDVDGRRVTLADGRVLGGDRVVVATGARPRSLPGVDATVGMHVLRTIDDATALRAAVLDAGAGCRVVVVGAGFIGSEVAATCAGLGCRVTVVEALATPLAPSLGTEVGDACASLHRDHGVTLRTGVGVSTVHAPGGGPPGVAGRAGRVELDDGTLLAADVVVVGIGVVPATDWLAGSGLELGDGVVCDHALFAADGIVAAGDLARWRWRRHGTEELVRIEHWQVAAEQGAGAARSLLAGRRAAVPFDPVPYFWSDQYGLRIQVLGRPSPEDRVVVVDGSLEEERFVALYGRDGRLSAAVARGRPRQLMSYRPLLAEGELFDRALAHVPA